MASNVVSLNGGPVVQREPNEHCVTSIRKLLEMAESGEVVGFAVAVMHGDGAASYRISGMTDNYRIIGAIECAKSRLVTDLVESE